MIEELHIRSLGVIEEATISFSPGLTVISGETGAGKTMVVSALQLLLGARADSGLVRSGADTAFVQAAVTPVPPSARQWALDEEDLLIVSREVAREGRSRARIGGRLVPNGALQDVLGAAVEIHAQHAHVRLGRPEIQRDLLDRFAGTPHGRKLQDYQTAYDEWRDLLGQQHYAEESARDRAREISRLEAEVAEIHGAGLDVEQDSQLGHELQILERADEIQTAVTRAHHLLGSDGASEPVGEAIDALRRLDIDDDRFKHLQSRAESLAAELTELVVDLHAFSEDAEADPAQLAHLQERRRVLSQLQRKYGETIREVAEYATAAEARISEIAQAEANAHELEERATRALRRVEELANEVHRGRVTAAERLVSEIDGHLAELGMPHARTQILVEALEADRFSRHGGDAVEFRLAPNPGEGARPLAEAVSGGERSRMSLAIEVALADVDQTEVLVFDEVDAGVGGATALAVGRKLARLAAAGPNGLRRQVLCVTHLAQLAVFADVHHVVEKKVTDGRTITSSRLVKEEDRVAELARMLGGDATADAGLEHARELLSRASEAKAS